jgi:hypothetical protein
MCVVLALYQGSKESMNLDIGCVPVHKTLNESRHPRRLLERQAHRNRGSRYLNESTVLAPSYVGRSVRRYTFYGCLLGALFGLIWSVQPAGPPEGPFARVMRRDELFG